MPSGSQQGRNTNEANIVRQGLATAAAEDGATSGQVASVTNGALEFVTAGGGSQPEPEPFFYYNGPATTIGSDGGYLTWVPANPVSYPGMGTNPLDLTDPVNPVVIADGNYDFAVEVECDQADAGKYLASTFYLDLDGISDGPGTVQPLDSGFLRIAIPCRRFLAAGTKIGVFAYHNGISHSVFLWVQASWELT